MTAFISGSCLRVFCFFALSQLLQISGLPRLVVSLHLQSQQWWPLELSEDVISLALILSRFPLGDPCDWLHWPHPDGGGLAPQSCPILWDPVDCSPPGSPVHGVSQARMLEWVAISFFRGSSWLRDWTQVSCVAGGFFTDWATREAPTLVIQDNLFQVTDWQA